MPQGRKTFNTTAKHFGNGNESFLICFFLRNEHGSFAVHNRVSAATVEEARLIAEQYGPAEYDIVDVRPAGERDRQPFLRGSM